MTIKTYTEGLEEYVESLTKILCSRKNQGEIVYFLKPKPGVNICNDLASPIYFNSVSEILNRFAPLAYHRRTNDRADHEYGIYYTAIEKIKENITIYSYDVTNGDVTRVLG